MSDGSTELLGIDPSQGLVAFCPVLNERMWSFHKYPIEQQRERIEITDKCDNNGAGYRYKCFFRGLNCYYTTQVSLLHFVICCNSNTLL